MDLLHGLMHVCMDTSVTCGIHEERQRNMCTVTGGQCTSEVCRATTGGLQVRGHYILLMRVTVLDIRSVITTSFTVATTLLPPFVRVYGSLRRSDFSMIVPFSVCR